MKLKEYYKTPKNPIVLSHGLFGFDTLQLFPWSFIPPLQYWRGINEALQANSCKVIVTAVPPSASIEKRAEALARSIEQRAGGQSVNIVGHSMGGIDARYMISRLRPTGFKVLSLTTVSSPHQGSPFADYVIRFVGEKRLPKLYRILERMGLETGAFEQLTTEFMRNNFNPKTPDVEGVKYFSYGASAYPGLLSPFRTSHRIIQHVEGDNDGLVSIKSASHGIYKGTLIGPSHLDIINWTNRLKWIIKGILGQQNKFNAIAFYLALSDMLAEEGL